MEHKASGKSLLITGLILTFLNTVILFTIIGKEVYDQVTGKDKGGSIVLANVDPEDANKLSEQFISKSNSDGEQDYYSPTLDLRFKYSSDKYFVSENQDGIIVMQNGIYNTNTYIKIRKAESQLTKEQFQTDLESLYEDVKLESEIEVEGLNAVNFTYVSVSLIDEKKSLYSATYIYRNDTKGNYFISIAAPEAIDVTKISSDLALLLKQAEIAPEGIDSQAKLVVTNGGVELTYDRKKWVPEALSDYTANLDFRSRDYESKDENMFAITSISVTTSSFGKNDQIEDYHEIYAKGSSDTYKEDNLKFISDAINKELAGKNFLYSEYTYEYFGDLNRVKVYTALSPSQKYSITIKVWSNKIGTDGEKEANKVLSSLKISEESSEELSMNRLIGETGSVLGSSSIEIDKAALVGKPSVVQIYNRTCTRIETDSSSGLPSVGGSVYNICSGGFGTGFYVSSDGYLITNGHVASPDPIDSIIGTLQSANPPQFWSDFAYDIGTILSQSRNVDISRLTTQDILSILLGSFIELNNQGLMTLTPTYSNYIGGEEIFDINPITYIPQNEASLIMATTVAGQVDSQYVSIYNAMQNKPSGLVTPDLAILKVDMGTKEFPILSLSSEDFITSGMEINVIGFPGIVNNNSLLSETSSQVPTITSGTLSAVKPNSTGTFNLIQIDASISGGNSGGPILNSEGEVVGVATYGLEAGQSGNYNFGVSVDEVSAYLGEKSVETKQGKITDYIYSGVDNLSKQYYKLAVKDFEKVLELYPEASDILTPLINISKKKIEQGEDKSPIIDTSAIEDKLAEYGIHMDGNTLVLAIVASVGLIVSSLFVIVVVKVRKRKQRNTPPPVIGNIDTTPVYNKPTQPATAPQAPEPISEQPTTQPPIQSTPTIQSEAIQQPPYIPTPTTPQTSPSITPSQQPVYQETVPQQQPPVVAS